MRLNRKLLTACFVVSTTLPTYAAKDKTQWRQGKLVSLTGQQGSDPVSVQTTGQSDANGNYTSNSTVDDWPSVDYQVVIDDGRMLYYATETLAFRWQHSPQFTENEQVKFTVDGQKLTVIDDAGKRIKLKIFKRRIKE